jgi:hypothetical protein
VPECRPCASPPRSSPSLLVELDRTYRARGLRVLSVASIGRGEQAPLPSVFLVRRDGTLARIERGYAKDASRLLVAEVRSALGIAPGTGAAAAEASPARAAASR